MNKRVKGFLIFIGATDISLIGFLMGYLLIELLRR